MSQITQGTDKPKRKAPKTAFKKGQSGNPGGRPKKTEEERTLEAMCRERTPEALHAILRIMAGSKQDRAKLAAAQYVLDRAWGKPKESVELSGADGGPIETKQTLDVSGLSPDQLRALASIPLHGE
jgi:hypothetical protein